MNITTRKKREDTLKIPVLSKKSRSTRAHRTTSRIKSLFEAFYLVSIQSMLNFGFAEKYIEKSSAAKVGENGTLNLHMKESQSSTCFRQSNGLTY